MSINQTKNRRTNTARSRQLARRRRRNETAPPRQSDVPATNERVAVSASVYGDTTPAWRVRLGLLVNDGLWHLRQRPIIWQGAGALVALVIGFLFISTIISGKIFPGVSAFGVGLGGLSAAEAETVLLNAWVNDVQINLMDGDRTWEVSPIDLGLQLDSRATAAAARGTRLSALPFGRDIKPVLMVDHDRAQDYLLNMAEEVSFPALNAGYEWDGDRLVGVSGRPGRLLDAASTVDRLAADPGEIVSRGRLDLRMLPLQPDVVDPTPYLEEARAFASQQFELIGYDPFRDEMLGWATDRDTLTSWLEAGSDGLTLREETFAPFLQAQNIAFREANETRFLEPNETMDRMREAIAELEDEVNIRIRYRSTQYEVKRGDTAFGIGRRTGIPMFLIQEANPGRDLNVLHPGDILNLPSRDEMVPLDPVMGKRIVVDLDTQTLVAYENGEQVFHWLISSGIATAPTSPGVYQILSHEPIAYGSSYTLCDETGCGQWEMEYFMGLYEVTPGLVNGFHGAVALPNGGYLGGGNVGTPYTLGCVMSSKDQARLLYEWADEGVVVEIISREFAPESDLAEQAFLY